MTLTGRQARSRAHRGAGSRLYRGGVALLVGSVTAALLCAACPVRSHPAARARTAPLQLGVTVFSMWRDWDQHERWFRRAAESGVQWLRVDVGWCSLEEAGPGKVSPWYQGRLDVTADAAAKLGLKLLVDVACTPRWAATSAANSYPPDQGEFERVARYLAGRYRGRVAAWEIWNEPNCVGGCGKGSPQEFVRVLKAGYRGIKAGDPYATVVSGGTSGNDVSWLRRMYAAGAAGHFDALAVHPYQDPATAPPDAPSEGATYRFASLPLVHDLMAANGEGTKPIWLTEFGWTTASTGPRPGVDAATQARFLLEAVRKIRADYPYVSHAFWFCLRDRDDWTPYENGFGLLAVDGTPKPGFGALRQANSGPTAPL